MSKATASLAALLAGDGYLSYAYAYPHKTAYRTLTPPPELAALWAEEDTSALFLYLHVPFCEQRCGFCNLFTQVKPKEERTARYVDRLALQAETVRAAIGPSAAVARRAIGGGTPTYLSAPLLDRLFDVAALFSEAVVPTSIEVSPSTLDEAKIEVLKRRRVTRVSMGVQSIFADETAGVQRRQQQVDVERSLALLAEGIPVRNVDLIYGLPGQTPDSLRRSIDAIVALGANEIYLYPLYVRPLTILGRHGAPKDERLSLYRAGRAHLASLGFRQASMRMFTLASTSEGDFGEGPVYRCQEDGMIGLGPGARSYTRRLHYASPFAVGQHAIRDRIDDWLAQTAHDHAHAHHGIWLDELEQRRRYVLLSLLDRGIDRAAFRARFGEDVLTRFPDLHAIVETGIGVLDEGALRLNETGIERADVLGHWLQSDAIKDARQAWQAV